MRIGGRTVELTASPKPGAPLIVLNGQAGEGARVVGAVRQASDVAFSLAAVSDLDWNRDLTPWPAPPAFRGGAPCAGLADLYLRELTEAMLPEILNALSEPPGYVALAGYSLAGLFALYAPFRTAAFARVASASGSVWYPGFAEFARQSPWVRRPDRAYLSLGDREARTRNAALRRVERDTRALAEYFAGQGVCTALEMNPGGHFDHPERRMARGIAWLLEDTQERTIATKGVARIGRAAD